MPMPVTNCSGEGETGLLGRAAIPLGHPPTAPSPVHEFGAAAVEQPRSSAPGGGSGPAWAPESPQGGWAAGGQPGPSLRWAAGRQPPGHLQASAALPCSSPAPKQALGSSGGSGAPPPSRALRFFDIWSVFGS